MPQVFTHIEIANQVAARLAAKPEYAYLAAHPKALNLGAVGPDMSLLLFDPIGSNEALNTVIDIYGRILGVIDEFKRITQVFNGPANDLENWLSGGLKSDIDNLVSLAYAAVESAVLMQTVPGETSYIDNPFAGLNVTGVPTGRTIKVQATSAHAPSIEALKMFGHPIEKATQQYAAFAAGQPSRDDLARAKAELEDVYRNHYQWWWMDILHYRRTGRFARQLETNAARSGKDHLKAFSLGYWTHVAGDVSGHPYVNGIVGGPFRTNTIRHMIVENVIDTWVWGHYQDADAGNGKAHELVDVGGDFDDIADLLIETIDQVYLHSEHNGFGPNIRPQIAPLFGGGRRDNVPNRDDWVRAYRTLRIYLRSATSADIQPPQPPPDSPQEFFEEIGESLARSARNVTEAFTGTASLFEIILALFSAALNALVLLVKIATLPVSIVTRLAALAPRWLLYTIQMAIYEYVSNTRWVLALSGLGKVSRFDLNRELAQVFYHLPPPRHGGLTGLANSSFPYRPASTNVSGFWLAYPTVPESLFIQGSQTGTESCPYPEGSLPSVFIDGPGYDLAKDAALMNIWQPATGVDGPAETVVLEGATALPRGTQLGNSVDLTLRLVEPSLIGPGLTRPDPPPSFDLDGDKGYGFGSWSVDDYMGSIKYSNDFNG